MSMRRFIVVPLLAWAMVMAWAWDAHSIGMFEQYAFHPSVAAQPESGRGINDLTVHNGELYLGYGDYTNNTGPIDVATVNLTTGAAGVKITANTEEIATYRKFNGHLYAPWVDPKGVGGLFSSDQSGSWAHTGVDVENVHIFDVAVLPNGVMLAVGSANAADRSTFLGATAFVSKDGGKTWSIGMTDLVGKVNPAVSGFERYYWIAMINGKAYIQARDQYSAYGQYDFPMRSFDGVKWSSSRKAMDCFVGGGYGVESFQGKAYCTNGRVLNGRRTTTTGGIYAQDFYQHNGTLYALSSDRIMRLEGTTWVQEGVALIPTTGRTTSLAVTDSHIYVGHSNGVIYRAAR